MKLNKWQGDNLHIDSDILRVDGCNKLWNFIVSEREAGKSTLMWKKVYNSYRNTRRPSIIVLRQVNDINGIFIDGAELIISKFTNQKITFKYDKGDLKSGGILDLFLTIDKEVDDKPFCRLIALNIKLARLKSKVLNNPKYVMIDEFIVNKRLGEKYLTEEVFKVKEGIINTYSRFCEKRADGTRDLTVYAFGNPYSVFNDYFSEFKIDTNKIYPGSFVVGDNYCLWNYQIKPELKEEILKSNRLYQFDDAYKKYAYDGIAILDTEIKVTRTLPENFKLQYIFKLRDKLIGIYHGYQNYPERLDYYAKLIDSNEVGKRRDIVCFDFGLMADRTVLFNAGYKQLYYSFRQAVEHRWIAFHSVEESWLIEEIYLEI